MPKTPTTNHPAITFGPRRHRRFRWAAMGALASAAAMTFGHALYVHGLPQDPAELDDYGTAQVIDPVPAGSFEAPVDIRSGCRIAAFGVAPWLKPGAPKDSQWERRTHKALAAMGVPLGAANEAIQRMRAGTADDALGMGNVEGVATASGQTYLPSFSTTYSKNQRNTVCHESQTRFASDHRVEYAVVYRIAYGDKTYHLGEFLACGNVSRFFPAPPAGAGSVGSALRSQPGQGAIQQGHTANTVPEPGTWALICAALAGLVFARRTNKNEQRTAMNHNRFKVHHIRWWHKPVPLLRTDPGGGFTQVGWAWNQRAYLINNISMGWVAFTDQQTPENIDQWFCPHCRASICGMQRSKIEKSLSTG